MRNGASAGVGRSRGIRRYETRAGIGERRSGYQMRPLEMVLRTKGNRNEKGGI